MKNIAKKINAAARPSMLAFNYRTRVVQSKKNDAKRDRRNWKKNLD